MKDYVLNSNYRSLPHRQLRNSRVLLGRNVVRSLPHRQLRNKNKKLSKSAGEITAA